MFASKTPSDLIRTPEDDALIANGDFREEGVYGQIPSKLYNAPNPILVEFRRYIRERPDAWGDVPRALIADGIDALLVHAGELVWFQGEDAGMDELVLFLIGAYDETEWLTHNAHADHARRVLTRLSNLEGAEA